MCSGSMCSRHLARRDRIVFEHTLFLPASRNPFHVTEDEARRVLDEMHEFAAELWFVNPVYLAALAERVQKISGRFPPVQAILASYQFLSHCQRRALAQHFNAPVFSLYSATDLGGSQIGIGCRAGNLHVRLDHVFVELLEGGRRANPGNIGTLVVTSHNRTMPLVRYDLRDLARFKAEPCGCDLGSAWPTLVLEGRERDAFITERGLITTKDVDDSLEQVGLALYQLTEEAPRRYRLDALPEKSRSEWRRSAKEALFHLLQPEKLSLEEVAELSIDASQKFRFTKPLPRAESFAGSTESQA